MDKSPKRSPKPKQKKQAGKELAKTGILEKELSSGKNENNNFANQKVKKGQAKTL